MLSRSVAEHSDNMNRNNSSSLVRCGCVALFAVLSPVIVFAGEPKVTNVDWEEACGGSNIRVTRVDGRIVAIDAVVEHYYEARAWQCHFKDGRITSALYRHAKVTRKGIGDGGQFTTEQHDDVVTTYDFPDHKLTGMPPDLLEDLQTVLAKANEKS
jgi:hypothetical protein